MEAIDVVVTTQKVEQQELPSVTIKRRVPKIAAAKKTSKAGKGKRNDNRHIVLECFELMKLRWKYILSCNDLLRRENNVISVLVLLVPKAMHPHEYLNDKIITVLKKLYSFIDLFMQASTS